MLRKFFFYIPAIVLASIGFGQLLSAHVGTHPDFVIENVSYNGTTLEYDIRNNGDASYSGTFEMFHRWRTPNGDTVWTSTIGGETVTIATPVEPGASVHRSIAAEAPTYASSVWLRLDRTNLVDESSETNNDTYYTLPDLGRPDFQITAMSVAVNRVVYTVTNNGNRDHTGSMRTRFTWINSGGLPIAQNSGNVYNVDQVIGGVTLPVGASITRIHSFGNSSNIPPVGAVRLRGMADENNTILERDENNNTLEVATTGGSFADLRVASASMMGQTITAQIANNGFEYTGSTQIRFDLQTAAGNRLERGEVTAATIPAAGTIGQSFTFASIPADAARVVITIDQNNAILETNESNNSFTFENIPVERPDFAVQNVSYDGTNIQYDIANLGSVSFSGSLQMIHRWQEANGDGMWGITIGGTTVAVDTPLEPGASMHRTIPAVAPLNAAYLEITADNNNSVQENNENDNRVVYTLPDLGRPDFAISNVTLNGNAITYTVTNNGSREYTDNLRTRFTWINTSGVAITTGYGGTGVDVIYSADLPVGEALTETQTMWSVPAGAARIRVVVDENDAVVETDETNNTMEVERSAAEFPELHILSAELTGQTVVVSMENSGGIYPILTPLIYRLQAPGGATVASHIVGNAPNVGSLGIVSYSYTLPSLPSTASSILITIDPNNAVTEQNETNNTFTINEFSTARPDFVVESAILSPHRVEFGIRNAGQGDFNAILTYQLSWLRADQSVIQSSNGGGPENLPIGASITRVRNNDAFMAQQPADAAFLRITVNPPGPSQVAESSSSNNTIDIAIPITTSPDFTVSSASIAPTEIHFAIQNIGEGDHSGVLPYRLEWLRADQTVYSTAVGGGPTTLISGASMEQVYTGTFAYVRSAEIRYLRVSANPAGGSYVANESNNANNSFLIELPEEEIEEEITEEAAPDFVAESPILNNTLLTFDVHNIGTGSFTGNLSYSLQWLNADRSPISNVGNANRVSIAAGASRTFTYGLAYIIGRPSNAVFLRVSINPIGVNHVNEADETNNQIEIPITPALAPDFVVENPTVEDSEISFTIHNTGVGTYSGLLTYQLKWLDIDGTILQTRPGGDVMNLPAGASISRSETGSFVLGRPEDAVSLRITVNPSGSNHVNGEAREDNNTIVVALAEEATPDFIVEIPVLADVTLTYQIRNVGTGSFSGNLVESYAWIAADGAVLDSASGGGPISLDPDAAVSRSLGGAFIMGRPDAAVALRITVNPSGSYHVAETGGANNIIELSLGESVATDESGDESVENDLAETDDEAMEQEVAEEASGDSEEEYTPRILPGNPLYFFKELGRDIRTTFTFDEEAKTDRERMYANQKLVETIILIDEGDTQEAIDHLSSYEEDMEDLARDTEQLLKNHPRGGEPAARELLKDQVAHQVVLSKLSHVSDDAELENALTETQGAVLDDVALFIDDIKNPRVIERALTEAQPRLVTSLQPLRHLEILEAVMERVPEKAAQAIERAENRVIERFSAVVEALPEDDRHLVATYASNAGGEELLYVKAMVQVHEHASGDTDEGRAPAKDVVGSTVNSLTDTFVTRIEKDFAESDQRKNEAISSIVRHVKNGNLDDARVLEILDRAFDPSLAAPLKEVKKQTLEKFSQNEKALAEATSDDAAIDLLTLDVLKNAAAAAPVTREQSAGISKQVLMKTQDFAVKQITEQFHEAKARGEADQFVKRISDETPESTKTITSLFSSEAEVKKELLSAQEENIEKRKEEEKVDKERERQREKEMKLKEDKKLELKKVEEKTKVPEPTFETKQPTTTSKTIEEKREPEKKEQPKIEEEIKKPEAKPIEKPVEKVIVPEPVKETEPVKTETPPVKETPKEVVPIKETQPVKEPVIEKEVEPAPIEKPVEKVIVPEPVKESEPVKTETPKETTTPAPTTKEVVPTPKTTTPVK